MLARHGAHLQKLRPAPHNYSYRLLGCLLPAPPDNDKQDNYRADAGKNSNRGYVHRLLPLKFDFGLQIDPDADHRA